MLHVLTVEVKTDRVVCARVLHRERPTHGILDTRGDCTSDVRSMFVTEGLQ